MEAKPAPMPATPDGSPACPACSVEVRDHATVHNYLAALDGQSNQRVARKLAAMREASERLAVLVEGHFSDSMHSYGRVAPK
jgi:hypothetical protein